MKYDRIRVRWRSKRIQNRQWILRLTLLTVLLPVAWQPSETQAQGLFKGRFSCTPCDEWVPLYPTQSVVSNIPLESEKNENRTTVVSQFNQTIVTSPTDLGGLELKLDKIVLQLRKLKRSSNSRDAVESKLGQMVNQIEAIQQIMRDNAPVVDGVFYDKNLPNGYVPLSSGQQRANRVKNGDGSVPSKQKSKPNQNRFRTNRTASRLPSPDLEFKRRFYTSYQQTGDSEGTIGDATIDNPKAGTAVLRSTIEEYNNLIIDLNEREDELKLKIREAELTFNRYKKAESKLDSKIANRVENELAKERKLQPESGFIAIANLLFLFLFGAALSTLLVITVSWVWDKLRERPTEPSTFEGFGHSFSGSYTSNARLYATYISIGVAVIAYVNCREHVEHWDLSFQAEYPFFIGTILPIAVTSVCLLQKRQHAESEVV